MATSTTSGGWNYDDGSGNAVGALWDVGSGTEEQNATYATT